jgi:hypothetical protein
VIDGFRSMLQLRGSLAALNSALATLVYTPLPNSNAGTSREVLRVRRKPLKLEPPAVAPSCA